MLFYIRLSLALICRRRNVVGRQEYFAFAFKTLEYRYFVFLSVYQRFPATSETIGITLVAPENILAIPAALF